MRKDEKGNKVRVRVFFGEIERDSETVGDGLRSIAAAVNRIFQPESTTVKILTIGSAQDHRQLAAAVERGLKDAGISEGTPESDKELGDRSAHNRRYNAVRADLEKVQSGVRIAVDEMINLAALRYRTST